MDQFELLFMISMTTDHVDLNMGLLEHTCEFMLVYTFIIWLSSVPLHCSSSPFPKNVFPVLQCYRNFLCVNPSGRHKKLSSLILRNSHGTSHRWYLHKDYGRVPMVAASYGRETIIHWTTVIFQRKHHRWSELENQLSQIMIKNWSNLANDHGFHRFFLGELWWNPWLFTSKSHGVVFQVLKHGCTVRRVAEEADGQWPDGTVTVDCWKIYR